MGNKDSKFLEVYTVNMGARRKNQSETAIGWTQFRKEYLNRILELDAPDIVFVQEGTVNLLNEQNLLKYHTFPASGSTGIIIKKCIPYSLVKKDIFPKNIRERIQAITIEYQNISLCFASFHGETVKRKLGTKSEEKRVWDNLRDLICTLDKLRKESLFPIVVGGDFNLDVDLVRKAVEGIKNSSLLVESTDEAMDHDYDFFIITYDMKCECKRERQIKYFPKDNTLSQLKNPIIDHSPTRLVVKPLKMFEKKSTEAIIDSLKEEVHDLKEEMETLLDKRKDQLRLLKEFANECPSEKFEVVDINFEEFREITEPDEDDGLIGYRHVLFLMTQAKSYERNKETLTQMDFKIKAPLEESEKHEDLATGGKELSGEEKKNPTERATDGKSKRKEASSRSPAAPSTSGHEDVAQDMITGKRGEKKQEEEQEEQGQVEEDQEQEEQEQKEDSKDVSGEHGDKSKSTKKPTKGRKKGHEENLEDLATSGKELSGEEKKNPTGSPPELVYERASHEKSKRKEASSRSPAAPSTSGHEDVAQGEHGDNAKSTKKPTKGRKKGHEVTDEDLATGGTELAGEEKKNPTERTKQGKIKRKEASSQSPAAPSTSGQEDVAQGEHEDNAKLTKGRKKGHVGTAVKEIEKRLRDMTVKEQSNTQKLKKKGK
uniref:Neurofilament medium polypeptide-like isoform X2 n=1 Tax=Crassostrea virginica TaxID=6565 RepID=A0A8B8BES7_CRAVI|nr:neurofilament medium polypeptide-like isoform X2 [Crassostrea virginica]